MDAIPIKHPVPCPFKHPATDDHVAGDTFQRHHTGTISRQVIQIRHNGNVNTGLHNESGDNVFFQFPTSRVFTLALRNDYSNSFWHGYSTV